MVFKLICYRLNQVSLVAQMVKNLPADAGAASSVRGLGRSRGEGNGNPLQYSCLGNPMDREARWAIVHGVTKRVRQDLATKTRTLHLVCRGKKSIIAMQV